MKPTEPKAEPSKLITRHFGRSATVESAGEVLQQAAAQLGKTSGVAVTTSASSASAQELPVISHMHVNREYASKKTQASTELATQTQVKPPLLATAEPLTPSASSVLAQVKSEVVTETPVEQAQSQSQSQLVKQFATIDDLPEGSECFLGEPPATLEEINERRSMSERVIEREMERQRDMELEPKRRLRRVLFGAFASLVVLGGVGGMIATMMVVSASKVNYRDTYKAMRELKTPMTSIRNNYACNDVLNYADNVYSSQQDYATAVENCLTVGEDALLAMDHLTSSEGYNRDEEIQEQYHIFRDAFNTTVLAGQEFASTMEIYQTWHKWLLASHEVDGWDETAADLKNAAKVLLDSGQTAFATYAEGWLKRRISAAEAYRNYYDAGYLDENRTVLREAMEASQQAFNEWDALNKPNIQTIAPLEVSGTAKLYSKFNHLYDIVKERYQQNYVSGSGDCAESISQIVCD